MIAWACSLLTGSTTIHLCVSVSCQRTHRHKIWTDSLSSIQFTLRLRTRWYPVKHVGHGICCPNIITGACAPTVHGVWFVTRIMDLIIVQAGEETNAHHSWGWLQLKWGWTKSWGFEQSWPDVVTLVSSVLFCIYRLLFYQIRIWSGKPGLSPCTSVNKEKWCFFGPNYTPMEESSTHFSFKLDLRDIIQFTGAWLPHTSTGSGLLHANETANDLVCYVEKWKRSWLPELHCNQYHVTRRRSEPQWRYTAVWSQ